MHPLTERFSYLGTWLTGDCSERLLCKSVSVSQCIQHSCSQYQLLILDLYFMSFPGDKTFIKAVVYTTYTIEILQTAMATREAFRILGTGWGNPEVLLTVGWLGVIIPILVSICSSFVWRIWYQFTDRTLRIVTWISQTFYAWRIWVLRRSPYIPIFVATVRPLYWLMR